MDQGAQRGGDTAQMLIANGCSTTDSIAAWVGSWTPIYSSLFTDRLT